MKRLIRTTLILTALIFAALPASAQYYEIANQVRNLITPALSGGANYKGYVEASVLGGLGDNRASIFGISTSQGFRYSSWFYMGAGIGVDVAVANRGDGNLPEGERPDYFSHTSSQTKAMIPVFSDFRFIIGSNPASTQAYIDLKLGATWLIGSGFLELADARIGGNAQFYLKPQVGVRVPVSASNPRQALNFGLTYQLITSSNNYGWYSSSVSLNNIGLSIAFEW